MSCAYTGASRGWDRALLGFMGLGLGLVVLCWGLFAKDFGLGWGFVGMSWGYWGWTRALELGSDEWVGKLGGLGWIDGILKTTRCTDGCKIEKTIRNAHRPDC